MKGLKIGTGADKPEVCLVARHSEGVKACDWLIITRLGRKGLCQLLQAGGAFGNWQLAENMTINPVKQVQKVISTGQHKCAGNRLG